MDEENENLEELENESTPNNENIPGEIEAEPPKNQLLAIGEKKVINSLLKINPWWWVFLGGFLAIILFIILMVSINQTSGGNDLYYKEGTCTTVTVKYEPYNEAESSSSLQMDMETYVQSAAVEYMKDLIEHEDETAVIQVYYALTIALRTEAVSNNCTVTYRDKQLSKNPSTNAYLDVVLKESKGVILGDSNHNVVSSAHVSDFCWYNVNENQNEYKIYPKDTLEITNDFVDNYVDNEIYKKCPCNDTQGSYDNPTWGECWTRWQTNKDKENEEPEYDYAWLHQDEETGFNVVGAYNLMRTHDYDYNLILKYFYGQNITYMTMNKENVKNTLPTQECSSDSVPYDSTPLSRDEFINAVTNFLSSGNYASWAQYFIDNAGAIYDMGQEKNVNPELIYIIARKETSFTKNNNDTAHYNYYGFAHGNESGSGKYFSNFMDGVETLFDWISARKNMDSVISGYSSLGEWLYNFDPEKESGLGGCYYMKEIYGDDYSRCNSSYYCAAFYGSNGKVSGRSSTCVNTTEEEKNAYHEWQRKQYLSHRKTIFNLSGTVCKGSSIQTDANLDIPQNMMKEQLSDYLTSQGTSIRDLNDTIYNNVISNGVGTRAGVASVATTLINYMQQFGVRIPYAYSGGHGAIKGVGRSTANLFGVDPQWGTSIGSFWYGSFGPYTHYGPDCSAFVYWTLHNGGLKVSFNTSTNMKTYGPNHAMDGSYIGQVGDILVSSGHVMMIAAVKEDEKYYIAAESNGLSAAYRPDTKGISYQKMAFENGHYVIVDMSEYYNDASKHYSTEEYATAFENGRLG